MSHRFTISRDDPSDTYTTIRSNPYLLNHTTVLDIDPDYGYPLFRFSYAYCTYHFPFICTIHIIRHTLFKL